MAALQHITFLGFDDIHQGSGIRVGRARSRRRVYKFGMDRGGRMVFCDRRIEDNRLPEGFFWWWHIRTPPRALATAASDAFFALKGRA